MAVDSASPICVPTAKECLLKLPLLLLSIHVLVQISLKVDPETRVWVQVVYLGSNLRKQG